MTRRLTPAELAEYQPLLDNAKKLRTLLGELQDLTLEIVQADSTQRPRHPLAGGAPLASMCTAVSSIGEVAELGHRACAGYDRCAAWPDGRAARAVRCPQPPGVRVGGAR